MTLSLLRVDADRIAQVRAMINVPMTQTNPTVIKVGFSWTIVPIILGLIGGLAVILMGMLLMAPPRPAPMPINDHMYENALKALLGQPSLTPLN